MLKSYLSYSKLARDIKITNGPLLDLFGVLVGAEWGHFIVQVSGGWHVLKVKLLFTSSDYLRD